MKNPGPVAAFTNSRFISSRLWLKSWSEIRGKIRLVDIVTLGQSSLLNSTVRIRMVQRLWNKGGQQHRRRSYIHFNHQHLPMLGRGVIPGGVIVRRPPNWVQALAAPISWQCFISFASISPFNFITRPRRTCAGGLTLTTVWSVPSVSTSRHEHRRPPTVGVQGMHKTENRL